MSAAKRPRLISLSFLVILTMMISSVFLVLINGHRNMKDGWADLPPDAVSEAYLKVLLQAEPGNGPARLTLAGLYVTTGDWERALLVLKEGGETFETSPRAQWLMLRVLLARLADLPAGDAQRPERQREIQRYLKTVNPAHLASADLAQLADYGLQMNAPEYAVICYLLLANKEPANAWQWLAKAAQWALSAGRPLEAAGYYKRAFAAAPDPAAAAMLAVEASRAFEAADRGDRALTTIGEALGRLPHEGSLLRRGVDLAIAQQQPLQALRWNRRYLEQYPEDAAALARQIDLEVQQGHKHQALLVSRRHVGLGSPTAAALEKHARLAEWNGQYSEALQTWQDLGQMTKDPRVYDHIMRVAQIGHAVDIELEALTHLVARPGLTSTDALRFAARFEYLGYPERAEQLLADYSGTHAPIKAVLTARAELGERMGVLEAALENRLAAVACDDAVPADSVQAARLLFLMGRGAEAYRMMRQMAPELKDGDPYALRLLGELGWQQGDYETAAAAYRSLWETLEDDNDFPRRRMILAYGQLGKTDEVVELLELRWCRAANPADLLAALTAARNAESWAVVGRLLAAADAAHERLETDEGYWQIKGDWHVYRREYGRACLAYRKALALDTQSTAAGDAILWSLINAGDLEGLRRQLEEHNRGGLPANEAYAAALRVLGRHKEALSWYEARLDIHRSDVLWLLDFADLLTAAGRGNSAYRVKRQALRVLMEQTDTVPDARMVELTVALKGIPAASLWLAAQKDPLPQAVLLNWWVYGRPADAARIRLLLQHIDRSGLPAWQQLQLAMAEKDHAAVEALLRQGSVTDAGDCMAAYAFLERDDLALAEIGRLGELQAGYRAAAVTAADSLPNLWETRFGSGSLGGLGITDYDGLFWRSRGPNGWGLAVGLSAFGRDDAGLLAISPDDEVRLNSFWRRRRDDTWSLDVGYRDGNGGSVFPLGLLYRSSDQRRWQYQLALQNDTTTEVSGLMRLLGVKDSLAAQADYRIDPRLSVAIGADRHRYETLSGSRLADGHSALANFSYQLFGGPNYWVVGGGATWEKNDVVGRIPADLRPWLTPAATTAALVPETYYDLGASMGLGRGRPAANFPQMASPRWFTDMWIGYIGPESTLGFAARAGFGTALFGGDEIGVTAEYDDRLNRAAGGGASYQVQFYYRFYLGR